MRTLNSAKNLASSLLLSFITIILGFITRKFFVDTIGIEYLGLNGLLQNILGVMTLLEGGFAGSVVYNLYKPIAQDDRPKIIALLQLYRKVYRYIALAVFICGLAIYPFIGYFIKDAHNLDYVSFVYFIFLLNSLIQYFTAYKWSIINANQKNYKLTTINIVYQIGLSLTKIAILYYTQNYILFLVIEFLFGIGYNVAVVRKANKLFSYITTKEKYYVDSDTKRNIITNMKALFFHALGGYFMHSTDNIIISSCVGIGIVGLYSNYTLLIGVIKGFVGQVLSSFSESVGHLIASESKEKVYQVFRTVFFVNFIVVSIPVIIFYNVLTPFVDWWLGKEYELSHFVLCIILINFYVDNMRSSALTFKVKSGIFVQDRFTPLLQGVINLVLSLILVKYLDLAGVLIATGISILSIGFWQFPRLIYKYTFKQPLRKYFIKYAQYTSIALIVIVMSSNLCKLVYTDIVMLKIIINGAISLIIVSIVYYILFRKSESFNELMLYAKAILKK